MLGYNWHTQTVVQPNVLIIITTQIAVFFLTAVQRVVCPSGVAALTMHLYMK